MSKVEKRLERMRRNPADDWTIDDVASVCRSVGVDFDPPTGGGSHYTVSHPGQALILTIPAKRPIKPVYIRRLVSFLDSVGSSPGRD